MCRIRFTDKRLLQQVSNTVSLRDSKTHLLTLIPGSGCMAALEAEKWLAEQEVAEGGIEAVSEAKKPLANGAAPEYRSNPLL